MNTATYAPGQAAATSIKPAQIYLSTKLSERFGVDYYNEGKKTIIHTDALDRADENWDEAHQAIIDQGGELRLEGAGYGWWNIIG